MRLRIQTFVLALSPFVLSACVAAKLAIGGEDATNISIVHPGAYRKNIELLLGKSFGERISSEDDRYDLYQYDAGTERNVPAAAVVVFFDVLRQGEVEYACPDPSSGCRVWQWKGHTSRLLAVQYDDKDIAVSVLKFNRLSDVPKDWRAPEHPASPATAQSPPDS